MPDPKGGTGTASQLHCGSLIETAKSAAAGASEGYCTSLLADETSITEPFLLTKPAHTAHRDVP
eukprot:5753021-Pleurochrysis_carterae.AAC.1